MIHERLHSWGKHWSRGGLNWPCRRSHWLGRSCSNNFSFNRKGSLSSWTKKDLSSRLHMIRIDDGFDLRWVGGNHFTNQVENADRFVESGQAVGESAGERSGRSTTRSSSIAVASSDHHNPVLWHTPRRTFPLTGGAAAIQEDYNVFVASLQLAYHGDEVNFVLLASSCLSNQYRKVLVLYRLK